MLLEIIQMRRYLCLVALSLSLTVSSQLSAGADTKLLVPGLVLFGVGMAGTMGSSLLAGVNKYAAVCPSPDQVVVNKGDGYNCVASNGEPSICHDYLCTDKNTGVSTRYTLNGINYDIWLPAVWCAGSFAAILATSIALLIAHGVLKHRLQPGLPS